MVTIAPTPLAWARATIASTSSAKSGKSRWQWLSTSMRTLPGLPVFRLHIARKDRARRRQFAAGRKTVATAEPGEIAFIGGHAQKIEQLAGRGRHERLCQNRDLAHHLGGDVEHRTHAGRIGLGKRPRRPA